MYGCRVIQKALESIPLEQQKLIIAELEGKVTIIAQLKIIEFFAKPQQISTLIGLKPYSRKCCQVCEGPKWKSCCPKVY